MATDEQSAEVLRGEILAQAGKEAEDIVERAQQEAASLLAAAASEARRLREEQRDRAHAEGLRRKELVLATCFIEQERLRVARIEALLDSIREEACRRLVAREGFDYREAAIRLATHGVDGVAGDSFVLRVSDADRDVLNDGFLRDVALRVGRAASEISLSYERDMMDGGVIVEDGEARRSWDNRLLARLERMWPDLRRQIALWASLVTMSGK
jgi:vacuolar-type H+-ATPase subunit E/Vma4